MTRLDPKSDAQANAEAVARRERLYADEHDRALARAARRRYPLGMAAQLRLFIATWEAELPGRLHARGVEWETPGRIIRGDGSGVTDPGGGTQLGTPRFNAETRAHLFGHPGRLDQDGNAVEPMHLVVDKLAWRHPLKAAVLRMIGRGGDWRTAIKVSCPGCQESITLPDEYSEAITRDALGMVWKTYQDEPFGSPTQTS